MCKNNPPVFFTKLCPHLREGGHDGLPGAPVVQHGGERDAGVVVGGVGGAAAVHDLGQVLLEQLGGEREQDRVQGRVHGQQEHGHPRVQVGLDLHTCCMDRRDWVCFYLKLC